MSYVRQMLLRPPESPWGYGLEFLVQVGTPLFAGLQFCLGLGEFGIGASAGGTGSGSWRLWRGGK